MLPNTYIYTRMPGDLFASGVRVNDRGASEDIPPHQPVSLQLKTRKFKHTRFSIFDWHPSIEKEEVFTRCTKATFAHQARRRAQGSIRRRLPTPARAHIVH